MDRKLHHSATRRHALRRLVAVGAAGGGMLGLLRAALAADPATGVRSIKGDVTIDGQPASIGQKIAPGQTVRTGAGSEAVFVIGMDAFLQREDSTFAIDSVTGPRTGEVVLRYITGKVLSVFGKGRKRLITSTATIGIRGTGCYLEVEPAGTYFCLCYGSAVVQSNANPRLRQLVRTRHHEAPLYIDTGTNALAMARSQVINHKDAELVMLEGLVGRVPPFHGKDYQGY